MSRPLRIAQVAPPIERVPPEGYGGTERVVHELVKELQGAADATPEQRRFAAATAVSLVQPYAPHIACELWERLGGERLWDAPWPVADPAMLVADTVTIAVQVNGKLRGQVEVPVDLADDEVAALAQQVPNVAQHLDGKTVAKQIVVPGRLVNLVVR